MTALNFKRNWSNGKSTLFKELILNGKKPHTIRPVRIHPIKAGMLLQLYQGLRTRNCELITELPCIMVRPIAIYLPHEISPIGNIVLDGRDLPTPSMDNLIINDGFTTREDFFDFFEYMYDENQRIGYLRLIQWAETPY
jgi:hypothetical protein